MKNFWYNKKVLITGCTGFKGSWLTVYLNHLGATVYGYSLVASTTPSMWEIMNLQSLCSAIKYADIRDFIALKDYIVKIQPEFIIHMAAQSLVRHSYDQPRETYEINVMGTVNLLEAARKSELKLTIINVTSDKCYENKEWCWGYRENDNLGGHDPYSNSKACAELVSQGYKDSFFTVESSIKLATVRAGNVIGGGDFATDRLIPDIINSFAQQKILYLRNPDAIRPWQHVLEPLTGYLTLAQNLYITGNSFSGAWNFGPQTTDLKTVNTIVSQIAELWGNNPTWKIIPDDLKPEANYLALDCSKAQIFLNWQPRWNLNTTLIKLIQWYQEYFKGQQMLQLTKLQIIQFMKDGSYGID